MAYYDKKNMPAENPLGLNENQLNDKEKSAHEQMEQEQRENDELNDGEKRGFWRKVYDKYVGKDIPHVYETTKERFRNAQEEAKKLEQESRTIAGAKKEAKLLEYEIALRNKKPEVAKEDKAPVTAQDLRDLRRVVEGQKSRAKYNGGTYIDVEPVAKQYNRMEAVKSELDKLNLIDADELLDEEATQLQLDQYKLEQELQDLQENTGPKEALLAGIAKMNKAELPPEDVALVNSIERKFNMDVRHAVFNGLAAKVGSDTTRAYTPEEMRLFLVTPEGQTMNKADAEKALAIIAHFNEKKPLLQEETKLFRKAEDIIRKLGNVNKIKPQKPKQITSGVADKVLKRQRIKTERAVKADLKPEASAAPDSDAEPLVVENSEQAQPVEIELSEKQILFKKIADLMNEDVDNYYPEAELSIFANPNDLESIDMVTAEHAVAALDKLRGTMKKTNVADIGHLELINEAEDYVREHAGMKKRVEQKNKVAETEQEKKNRVFDKVKKLIDTDEQQAYFLEEYDMFDKNLDEIVIKPEAAHYGLSAINKLRESRALSLTEEDKQILDEAEQIIKTQTHS